MTFTYDYPTRKILYYGDPTLVHEAFNFQEGLDVTRSLVPLSLTRV